MQIAAINLRCGTDIKTNLIQAAHWIEQAAKAGAEFIATPENTLIMQAKTKALFATIKPEHDTEAVIFFANLAARLKIHLLIGSMAIKLSDTKAANRSFLFAPDGKIIARYDKMHMFDVKINETESWQESANYRAGKTPVMADVENFKLGFSICYDLRFANLYKYYAMHGAEIISVPAAFTAITGKAHWQILLRARAIETSSYIIAPAQGGEHEGGRKTWGHSMIVDPWGDVIAHIDNDEPGFCLAEISHERIKNIRSRIPAWQKEIKLP